MFNHRKRPVPGFILTVFFVIGIIIYYGWSQAFASDDHDEARDLKDRGQIIALSELISNAGLADTRILEAELDKKHGKLVYELEFLDAEGRVFEQYFDAITGEPLSEPRRD